MNTEAVVRRMETLRREIAYHSHRYYVLDSPLISDSEYDALFQELQLLEKEYPQFQSPDSPTQRTGGWVSDKFRRVSHPRPILSLANAFSSEDLLAWQERIARLNPKVSQSGFIVEPKIDGLTVILHYRAGVFELGATRGDGAEGEDITPNLRTVRTLPLRIPVDSSFTGRVPTRLVVRGEAFIRLKPFEALNAELAGRGEKIYVNPRNAAAGALRQLDSRLTAGRPIDLLCYAIVEWEGAGKPSTQWETLQVLRELGFPVSPDAQRAESIQQAMEFCGEWDRRRNTLDYEVDGVVIKLDDLPLSDELGFVGKDPRGSVAYKFPAREVSTVLQEIGVNVGRTGVLTPFAVLEPVVIGGVTVSRATLHNFDFIRERDIRVGDTIMIKRAGDVIPYVIGPILDKRTGLEKTFSPPARCPSCREPVHKFPDEVALYCINASCPAQLIRNVEHFASRSAMDIEGLGIRIIEQLVEVGLVKNLTDLYQLTSDDLLRLEGFAEKKAENLVRAIGESKGRSLPRLLTGLGIHGVGEVLAMDLARHFGSLEPFNRLTPEDLQTIPGVGPNLAESILGWFSRKTNRSLLEKFRKLGIWPEFVSAEPAAGPFSGKQFVVTGTLEKYSREGIKTYIQQQGGKVQEAVSRKTDYLVAGENPGSKLQKAQSLGIPVLSEQQLEKWAQSKEKPA